MTPEHVCKAWESMIAAEMLYSQLAIWLTVCGTAVLVVLFAVVTYQTMAKNKSYPDGLWVFAVAGSLVGLVASVIVLAIHVPALLHPPRYAADELGKPLSEWFQCPHPRKR